jgi:cob(I)alamin adenosyltransferase
MVRLTRITTRGGDGGETSLGDGSRVPKHHARVEAYGEVDELNAVLGLAGMELERDARLEPERRRRLAELLEVVQNQLFDLGADLCVPGAAGERLRLPAGHVAFLEAAMAEWQAGLPPLESFVLPAGPPPACQLHHARTVCRRAERALGRLSARLGPRTEPLNPSLGVYLNRLSDLLFVLARVAAGPGGERLWRPGG